MAQRLRLLSGLVLFSYVTTHLLNHACGMFSLAAAEAGRFWFTAVWRHPLGTLLLYGSLLTHFTLVLLAVYRRRHLRIPRWELLRLGLGLIIPYLLLTHAFGTRVTHEVSGVEDNYARQVYFFWVLAPEAGLRQIVLLVVAWTHGCIGVYSWIRVKRRHTVTVRVLSILAPLLPILAVVGFVDMGQEVSLLAADPDWVRQAYPPIDPEQADRIGDWRDATIAAYLGAVAAVFVARQIRTVWQRRGGVVRLTYPGDRRVLITPGTTVLEASRAAGIPHASLCGGRGRCSTCRTRVVGQLERLPRPSADEARVLRRVGAPPDVRLACQLRPTVDLQVFPLLPPAGALPGNPLRPGLVEGAEREIAILFGDLRGYSRFAEQRLPFDVVFVLNQYFAATGAAVERAGGHLDKFIGDGVMALFGLEVGPARGCRQALEAAIGMAEALDRLNVSLAAELREPLRIGIGIHVGSVIVGELGYGRARALTAVGDAVNIASRLEALNKEYASQLILSEDVATCANLDLAGFARHEIAVRGRSVPLAIRVIPAPADLRSLLSPVARPAPGASGPAPPSG